MIYRRNIYLQPNGESDTLSVKIQRFTVTGVACGLYSSKLTAMISDPFSLERLPRVRGVRPLVYVMVVILFSSLLKLNYRNERRSVFKLHRGESESS